MTTALVVSPRRYTEMLADSEFRANYNAKASPHLVGYAARTPMRVYVHSFLVEEAREVIEERLLLALSLEDRPTEEADEAEMYKARINLMGWTVTESYDPHMMVRLYKARRGGDTRSTVSMMWSVEMAADPIALGHIYRKLAYAVWRMWAPTFIWLPDQDSNLEPSG